MVKTGQSASGPRADSSAAGAPIREVRFHNPRLQGLGLDTLTLSQLQSKGPPEYFARPERLEFYQLIHFTGGIGTHQVDFRTYRVRRSTLVVAQPKQVQQFYLNRSMKGRLLLMDPVFLSSSGQSEVLSHLDLSDCPAWLELPAWLDKDVLRVFEIVTRETSTYQGDALTARFLQHLVLALLLEIRRFALNSQPSIHLHPSHHSDVIRLLQAEVEASFHRHRSVRFYAQRLGYSEKTLTRACAASQGRTAKELIDERVALEAKRLLAHSRSTPAEIACQLGFSEATNFVKFFKRMAGCTPSTFRSQITAAADAANHRRVDHPPTGHARTGR